MKNFLLLITLLSAALFPTVPALAQDGSLVLTPLGTYETGLLEDSAAEIVAHDPKTQRLFVVNAADSSLDVLDIADPNTLEYLGSVDISEYGGVANSVDIYDGLVAVAIEQEIQQESGIVAFFNTDGEFLNSVEVGALPDMLTFTPDGMKVLVANEGLPNDDYDVDPEGTISIIDLSFGVDDLAQSDVTQVDFRAFNDAELDESIRIFGPDATVAQDLEPEYITVSADSTTAWVTLQENNALATIDLEAGEAVALTGLGYKNWNAPQATMDFYQFVDLPVLGETDAGQEILLGGFSGLHYQGVDDDGLLYFVTHPDTSPSVELMELDGEPVRPVVFPDYQSLLVHIVLDPSTGEVLFDDVTYLTDADENPISGLPNLPATEKLAHMDELSVDLAGNVLDADPLGADMEGIVRAEDGSYWMVDEHRPSIYHFDEDGVLMARFVPEGANSNDLGVDVGFETLPAVLGARRANRGFEGVALDGSTLYAFVQSPIDNPDHKNDDNSKRSLYTRIIEFDTDAGETIGQYLYKLDGGASDKIGDAVALGNGEFLVIERDSATGPDSAKNVYKISLEDATNFHEFNAAWVGPNGGLELQTEYGLARAGIFPVKKELYVDLSALGYSFDDKPEGLAFIDENTLAVLNDNDFGLTGGFDPATGLLEEEETFTPPILGIIHLKPIGIDVSDRDEAVSLFRWPIKGIYQPDSIVSYEVDGRTYLVTANEGDARDYDGYSEEVRVADLALDWAAFPNGPLLQLPENLGRLKTTTATGDADGDGLHEEIYTFGGRSFSIWRPSGQLVFDSGSDFAEITSQIYPENFNANGENDSFDSRSDDKGAEPEALAIGEVNGSIYAFVGLERIGGIMVYDISNPRAPVFQYYVNNRDFDPSLDIAETGDLAPEGITFIHADDSPTGDPMLAVGNEFSGTVTMYAITFE